MTSRLSTNEAHSDGKLYDNLNKEVPVSSDYDQLRVTDTILDSKMYVFFPLNSTYAYLHKYIFLTI